MRLGKSFGPSLLFLTLASVPARAGDGTPQSVLKEKGLSKSGTVYVLEAEQPVLQKMKEVKAAIAIYAKLAERRAGEEQAAAQISKLEASRDELQGYLADLNQQINEHPSGGQRPGPMSPPQSSPLIQQRDQVKATLAQTTGELKSLKAEASKPEVRKALEDDVNKRGEALRSALAELRPMVDDVARKYAVLEADAEIKKARSDFQKATKANLKLGPSDAFKAGVKAIDQAELELFGKKPATASRKKAKARK